MEFEPAEKSAKSPELDMAALLRRELESRIRRNPRFSLRRFAQILEIDPTNLSKIMRGKQVPGRRLANRLLHTLGINPRPPLENLTLDSSQISIILAVALKDLPVAKEMLKEFCGFFARKLDSSQVPGLANAEVYQLSLSFFPVTQPVLMREVK